MKTWTLALAVSAAANVALGAYWWSQQAATDAATSAASAKQNAAPAGVVVDAGTWQRLQGADEAAYVANLRRAGAPPELLRAIVADQIAERFESRRRAVYATAKHEYWRSGSRAYRYDSATRLALADIQREEAAESRRLLGADADTPTSVGYRRARFGDLPVEKAEQVERILSDYSDLRSETRESAMGLTLPGDVENLKLLVSEQRADLAKVLTPEELAAYELRSSDAASTVRRQLTDFEVSETEYRALFALQKAFDDQWGNTASSLVTTESYRARQDAARKLKEEMAAVVGTDPERQTQFLVSSDGNYSQVKSLVQRLNLPATTTAEVILLSQSGEKQMQALQSDRTLTQADRLAKMSALQTEAVSALTAKLGTEGLDAYKRSGGFWIQNLEMNLRTQTTAPAVRR